jgi:hypothetical protein
MSSQYGTFVKKEAIFDKLICHHLVTVKSSSHAIVNIRASDVCMPQAIRSANYDDRMNAMRKNFPSSPFQKNPLVDNHAFLHVKTQKFYIAYLRRSYTALLNARLRLG